MASNSDSFPTALGRKPTEVAIHWILRIAISAEFVGHGAFGIMGKDAWLAYYDVFGIGEPAARVLMPLTGTMDITLGVLILLWPSRAQLAFMAFWGLFTATLRPLAGEGVFELVERAYNFGVPLALLLLHGLAYSPRQWIARIRDVPRLTTAHARQLMWLLRAVVAGTLIGHGGLGAFYDNQRLIGHYESVGLTRLVDDPRTLNLVIGVGEIVLGCVVFLWPASLLLAFVCVWKMCSEMLFVTADAFGAPFEVVERGGAYAAPIALILLKTILARRDLPDRRPADGPIGTINRSAPASEAS